MGQPVAAANSLARRTASAYVSRVIERSLRPSRRSRWRYAAAVAATIAAGLASRRYAAQLPWWLAKNAGDALYATMVFWGLGLVVPRARTASIALAAAAVCFAIELAQLYQAPWIDAVRATTLGRLVLGQGFHALDLVCYAIGAGLGAALELGVRRPVRSERRTGPAGRCGRRGQARARRAREAGARGGPSIRLDHQPRAARIQPRCVRARAGLRITRS
jgi:hypothetical protein